MEIGGLQPVTLLDYPQKVAAIIFTSGCNMRCPFCYNPSLVLPEMIKQGKPFPEADVLAFLKKRKKYLDGVVITGGEPTIQPKLKDFCRKLKKIGYLVKLDSNGLLPQVLQELLEENLVDYLAMDIKGPLDQYCKFAGVDADPNNLSLSISLIKKSGLPYEFRSTLSKSLHKEEDFEAMAQAIKGADLYYLQNFHKQDKLVGEGFASRSFTGQELQKFVEMGSKFVKKCLIR